MGCKSPLISSPQNGAYYEKVHTLLYFLPLTQQLSVQLCQR